MKKLLLSIFAILLSSSLLYAAPITYLQTNSTGTIFTLNISSKVVWADGSISTTAVAGGGSGGGMSPGATYYVQLNPSGQQSGSFYVQASSATDYYGSAATFQGAVSAGQFYAGTASPLYRLDIQGDSGLGVSSPLSNFAYTGNGNSIRAITTGNAASAFFSNTSAGSSASALKVQKTSGEAPAAEFIVVASTAISVNGGTGLAINVAFGQTRLKETTIESWSTHAGSSTFVSTMTLSGGYLVQNIPPTNGQVLKFNGTVWAPGTDSTAAGGGDNLGDHVSTKTLTAGYGISASTIAASQWITASSVTFTSATIAGCTIDSSGIGCLGSSNAGEMRLYELPANGSNYVSFISSNALAGNVVWTLPNADGSGCFQSNGSGLVTIGSCGSGSDNLGNGTGSFGVNTSTGGFSSWVSVSSNTYLAAGNTFYHNASPQFTNAPIVSALTASSWVKTDASKKLVSADNKGSVGITYDGGGSALTAGGTTFISVPFSGTVTGWTVVSTSTGSIVVDVKKCSGFNCSPTTSIAGTEKPTLSSVWANQDLSLGTWTTSVTEGDKIAFVMDSVATITNANIVIHINKQ